MHFSTINLLLFKIIKQNISSAIKSIEELLKHFAERACGWKNVLKRKSASLFLKKFIAIIFAEKN
jgi:hypothetical protein